MNRRIIVVALGNGFEFYDFTIYSFFAGAIGRAFFTSFSPWTSLLLSFATFGIGFGARPLGAAFFGAFADRHGPKRALLLTIVLMAFGTLGLAIMPGYASWGLVSPILVVLIRLVQGFALGGEIGPSTIYLLDAAPVGRRAQAVSLQTALHGVATFAAGTVGLGMSALLTPESIDAWGWRLAMALGVGVVPVGLTTRMSLPDHPRRSPSSIDALSRSIFEKRRVLLAATLLIMSGSVTFYLTTYLNTYALTVLRLSSYDAFSTAIASGGLLFMIAPVGGFLADRLGRHTLWLFSRVSVAVCAVPAFAWLLHEPDGTVLRAISAGLAALNALGGAAGLCIIVEAMPAAARATGLAVAYALGASLFGGTAQFVVTALIAGTADPMSIAYYLAAASVVGAGASFFLR